MANIVYNKGLELILNGGLGSAVIRCMLERSTSTYSPDKSHDDVGDLTNFVEISVAAYSRKTLGSVTPAEDDAEDRADLGFAAVEFGNLESGQTVKGLVFYAQVSGDDTTPNDDILLAYMDSVSGLTLPFALGGGAFTVSAGDLFRLSQSA